MPRPETGSHVSPLSVERTSPSTGGSDASPECPEAMIVPGPAKRTTTSRVSVPAPFGVLMLPAAASGVFAPGGTRKNVGPLPASSVPSAGSIAIEPMSEPAVVADVVLSSSSDAPPQAATSEQQQEQGRT